MKPICLVLFSSLFVSAPLAKGQRAGVFSDPTGSVDVRAEKNADYAVIATVKNGEPFTFECENGDWCKVTLAFVNSAGYRPVAFACISPKRIC